MENLQSQINLRAEVLEIKDQIIDLRRHFHQYPELKYEELKTAEHIVNLLRQLNVFEIHEKVGKTGVVAILKGSQPGPCIMVRADMDALPLTEQSGDLFESKIKGVHHACGHDGHIAMALGCAIVISKWQQKIKGIVKFVFQPAEEGGAGSMAMINDPVYPVLENPQVDKCFGIHLNNSQLYGKVQLNFGPMTAASDRFYIKIKGVGTHAMCPHNGIDAVMIGCQLVNALYTITARNVDPMNPFTLSVGIIQGGTAQNIVSENCNIEGTLRTLYPDDRDIAQKRIEQICEGFEKSFDCKIDCKYVRLYDSTVNDEKTVAEVEKSAKKITQCHKSTFGLAGEDFCFYSQRKPSALFLVGSAPEGSVLDNGKTILRPHHSPFFTIDERSLLIGSSVWVQLIEDQMVN